MNVQLQTPSEVLYSDLWSFAGINSVGVNVFHRHLRISYIGDTWYATELESMNGPALITEDGSVEVIEPPRSARTEGETRDMMPIENGDVLALGNTTKLLVLRGLHRIACPDQRPVRLAAGSPRRPAQTI